LAEAERALQGWREAELRPIDPHLLALAQGYVEAELKGREALGNRLGALITLAGALLASGPMTGAMLRPRSGPRYLHCPRVGGV
jgi:hypothetical protein